MKHYHKLKSHVWHFFERPVVGDTSKTVLCKLCTTKYTFLGNTSNLKSHLVRKHPIQWNLVSSGQVQNDLSEVNENREIDEQTSSPKSKRPRTHYVYEVKTSDNEDTNTSDNESHTEKIEDPISGSDEKLNEEWLIENPFDMKIKKNKKRQIKKTREVQPSVSESYIIENNQPKDQYNTFGDYIAHRIRNLKDINSKGHVQQLISTVMWQAEYGAFNDEDNVKNLLMNIINCKAKDPSHADNES